MSLYTTTINEGPSFNHRKLERPPPMNTTRVSGKLREQTYIIDFSRLKKQLGKDVDLFYFYPQEVDGFIASTVSATQREHEDPSIVDRYAYNDLYMAYQEWRRKEEEANWRSQASWNGLPVDDFELDAAGRAGELITDYVLRQMAVIRDAHGDYALSPDDFLWTENGALVLKVFF